jgi:hypothetical protein
MSMGKTQKSESTQKSDPWAPAMPGLQYGLGEAKNIYNQRQDQQFFPGQTFADFDPATTSALAGTDQRATSGSPLVQAAQGNIQGTLSGDYLSQGNPYMAGLQSRIMADVMPGINATFSRAGRTGSDSHGYSLARGLGDAFAPIQYQNYEAERGRQMQAASMAPTLANQDYQDLAMLRGVGAEREAQAQRGISEDMMRYDFDQNRQARALQEYMGTLMPAAQLGGTSSGTQTQTQENSPLQTALGLGMMAAAPFTGGASLGMGGMLGGAAAGGLGSLFGGGAAAAGGAMLPYQGLIGASKLL